MIDTAEKRRSALDFGKGCGTGMPIPLGSIPETSRAHVLALYTGILPPASAEYAWRNKNTLSTSWKSRVSPTDSKTQEL
jgi:hypothetical protein